MQKGKDFAADFGNANPQKPPLQGTEDAIIEGAFGRRG